jgi:hypothetical protein
VKALEYLIKMEPQYRNDDMDVISIEEKDQSKASLLGSKRRRKKSKGTKNSNDFNEKPEELNIQFLKSNLQGESTSSMSLEEIKKEENNILLTRDSADYYLKEISIIKNLVLEKEDKCKEYKETMNYIHDRKKVLNKFDLIMESKLDIHKTSEKNKYSKNNWKNKNKEVVYKYSNLFDSKLNDIQNSMLNINKIKSQLAEKNKIFIEKIKKNDENVNNEQICIIMKDNVNKLLEKMKNENNIIEDDNQYINKDDEIVQEIKNKMKEFKQIL